MLKGTILLLACSASVLATPLIARATTLKCDDPVCGGDILYNTQEVWDGYLRSLAKQLDLDPNASDLINVIKRAGGGWCRDQPDTNVPSDPIACWRNDRPTASVNSTLSVKPTPTPSVKSTPSLKSTPPVTSTPSIKPTPSVDPKPSVRPKPPVNPKPPVKSKPPVRPKPPVRL